MHRSALIVGILLTVGCAVGGYLLLQQSDDPDRQALKRLATIEQAMDAVLRDFEATKKGAVGDGDGDGTAQRKKALAQINADVDLIFAELDQVRGGDGVKKRRKTLADRLRPLADEVDQMIAAMVPH
jgi:hypothetical protein